MLTPKALTAVMSGDAQALSVYEQVLVTALGLSLTLGVLVVPRRWRVSFEQRFDSFLTVASMVLALVSLMLISFVKVQPVPSVVALLLGVLCGLQLYLGARDCSHMGISTMTLWVSVALCLAVLATTLVNLCFDDASQSTFFIGALMLLCACRFPFRGLRRPQMSADGDNEEPYQGRLTALIANDWEPLIGGCICAIGFGLNWNWPFAAFQFPEALLPFIGRLIACLVLIVIFALAGKRLASDSFNYLLALAALVGAFVWSSGSGDYSSAVLFLFANISQILFFGLLWIQTSFTGRDSRDPASLPCLSMLLFCVSFILGALSSQVVSFQVTTLLIPLFLLIYIYALIVSALRQSHRQIYEVSETLSYNDMFDQLCERMGRDYALSRRESEILPFLVLGQSTTMVGKRLFISPQTVKTHAHRIYTKMGIHSHDELIRIFDGYMHEEKQ